MRRIVSVLLLTAMLLSLSACSSASALHKRLEAEPHNIEHQVLSAAKAKDEQSAWENYAEIYGKERIELPGSQAVLYGEKLTGSKIFSYGIDSYNNTVFYLLDPDDCSTQILPIQLTDADNVYYIIPCF